MAIIIDMRLLDEALRANELAMDELKKQRIALLEAKADKPFFSGDLIPYAARMQQAGTSGALAYYALIGEAPAGTS